MEGKEFPVVYAQSRPTGDDDGTATRQSRRHGNEHCRQGPMTTMMCL